MKYLMILESTKTGFSSYSPDLPGCAATGATRQQVLRRMKEAVAFHLEGLREEGFQPPEPKSEPSFVEVL